MRNLVVVAVVVLIGCKQEEQSGPKTPRGARVAPEKPKKVPLETLDWKTAPKWSAQLQFDANGGAVIPTSCPKVRTLRESQQAKAPSDEFDEKEREVALKKAQDECLAESKAAAKPLPELSLVEIPVEVDGEYDFKFNSFWLKLKRVENQVEVPFSVRETGTRDVDGIRVMAVLMDHNGTDQRWSLPHLSGLAIAPAPSSYFPSGSDRFALPMASTEAAKQTKPRLKSGAAIQVLVQLGSPKAGTGLVFKSTDPFKGSEPVLGVRARPLALRFVADGDVVAGPFDLQK
jgi:hypothetical protein